MLSLKICSIVLVCELAGGLITMAYPLLKMLGIPNLYLPDTVLVFIVVPVVHLLNDDDTKEMIVDGKYYEALRHMMGCTERMGRIKAIQKCCPQ